jgi:hypothetical protein
LLLHFFAAAIKVMNFTNIAVAVHEAVVFSAIIRTSNDSVKMHVMNRINIAVAVVAVFAVVKSVR